MNLGPYPMGKSRSGRGVEQNDLASHQWSGSAPWRTFLLDGSVPGASSRQRS
jgi:hypothetical protein